LGSHGALLRRSVPALNNTHASATEKGGKVFQVVDLADEANGVKNEALHEFFEVSVVENAAFLGKSEGDFVNNEVCLTNCEGDAVKNEVRCENFEGTAKKNEARCENCKDGAVKNEVRLENFEGDFVINEDRFELEEGFFRQDYRIIRIDSCVSSSVSPVSFDSLAPALLALRANLRLLFLKGPAFSIVVNSAGFVSYLPKIPQSFEDAFDLAGALGAFAAELGGEGFGAGGGVGAFRGHLKGRKIDHRIHGTTLD